MKVNKRLFYFSLNPHSSEAFYSYVNRTLQDRQNSFLISDEKNNELFKHASDLALYLDEQSDLGNFYVIIDYLSFFNCHLDDETEEQAKRREKENKEKGVVPQKIKELPVFSAKKASVVIANTILRYPEVMFLFDESWNGDSIDANFTQFIFHDNYDYATSVFKEYHQYRVTDEEPFAFIKRNRNNLYDGSNLRFAIKRYIYESLKVKRYNFSQIQDSRAQNLALCVEEEHSQNRFNSYALYANGFRVLPVVSAGELKDFNGKYCEPATAIKLIVRDYDLQFPDNNGHETDVEQEGLKHKVNEIDYIRGGKFWKETDESVPTGYTNRWFVPVDNIYWNKLCKIPTLFISKGVSGIEFLKTKTEWKRRGGDEKAPGKFEDKKDIQNVRGIMKPVSGIYYPFHFFEEITNIYKTFEITTKSEFMSRGQQTNYEKSQEWVIETNRRNHDHGVPLDIYDLVKNMLNRARHYYDIGKFIRAAVISSEVIEILNGFHEALMLRAYHLLAISENAIAMDAIGGSESSLEADAKFRIDKIRHEVSRIVERPIGEELSVMERRELKFNTLNQIYSDCRIFCREKEHFDVEDCFISAIAHENDGYTLKDIFQEIASKWERNIKDPLKHFISTHSKHSS